MHFIFTVVLVGGVCLTTVTMTTLAIDDYSRSRILGVGPRTKTGTVRFKLCANGTTRAHNARIAAAAVKTSNFNMATIRRVSTWDSGVPGFVCGRGISGADKI